MNNNMNLFFAFLLIATVSLFLSGCPSQEICGDGTCDAEETFSNCQSDCGVCEANSDCREGQYIGEPWCQLNGSVEDVYRNLDISTCGNSRTPNAVCVDALRQEYQETCEFECENGYCQNGTNATNCTASCVDQDGGNNSLFRGNVNVTTESCQTATYWDTCYDNMVLKELLCVDDALVNSTVVCENGCSEGVCQ